MESVTIGRSDIKVLPMGVGTMAWGLSRLWGYGDSLDLDDVAPAFTASIEAGLTLFDTAEVYGWGRSERTLGQLVKAEQTPVVVATKYAPTPTRFSPKTLGKALDRSLRRLGLKRVDLYQIHWPYGWVKNERLMDALADAVEAGKIRYAGVSNFNEEQMRKAFQALARRGVPLVSNQVEYSLVKRAPERNGVLDTCRELDITLIAYSPLGRGVLSGKYRPGSEVAGRRRSSRQFKQMARGELDPLLDALEEIGSAHGNRPSVQVALNWLARQPGVVPIPGAKNEEQARQNAASIEWEMTEQEAERLDRLAG